MKKRKINFIILILIISLVFVSGCSQQQDQPEQDKPEEQEQPENEESDENTTDGFPDKPVEIVVPWGAGGSVDLTARILAKHAEKYLGQPIVVVNMTGGSGSVAFTEISNSEPNGYKLVMGASPVIQHKYLLEGITYDYSSWEPIIMLTKEPNMIVVKTGSRMDLPLEEFLQFVEENPGEVMMAVGGHWASHDIARAALELESGLEFKKIAFDGGAEVVSNLLGGHVDCGFNYLGEFASHVEAGDLKVLASTGEERHPFMDDVPTFNELEKGWDLSTIGSWKGILAPKNTPQEVLDKLYDAFDKTVQDSEYIEEMTNAKLPIIIKGPEEFSKMLEKEDESIQAITDKLKEEGKQ